MGIIDVQGLGQVSIAGDTPTAEEAATILKASQLKTTTNVPTTQEDSGGVLSTVANWFTGSKTTEFPEMESIAGNTAGKAIKEQAGVGAFAKIVAGTFLTPDLKAQGEIMLHQIPGSSIVEDKFRNPILVMPDGQTFYLNKPGADTQDIAQLSAQLVQMIPGAGYVAKKYAGNMFMRGLMQGAHGGAISVAQDVAAMPFGAEEIDKGKFVINAVIPAVAEVALTPIVNTFINKFGRNKQFFTVDLEGVPTLTAKGTEAAKAAGLDVTQLDKTTLSKAFDVVKQNQQNSSQKFLDFEQAYTDFVKSNPSSVSQEFGVTLTQAQATGNKPGIATLYEATKGTYGDKAREAAVKFLNNQNIALGNASKSLIDKFNKGEIGLDDVNQAGEVIINTVKNNFKKKSLESKTAYNLINPDAIYTGGSSNLDVLEASIAKNIQDTTGSTIDQTITPRTIYALNELKGFINKIKSGSTQETQEGIRYVNATDFNKFDSFRKKLANLYKGAQTGEDRANLMAIKEEFDKFTNDALDNALFGSGENKISLEAVKKSRETFQERRKLFFQNPIKKDGRTINNDPGGEVVQKILEDKAVTPEKTIDWIFGTSNIGAKKDASEVVQRLKKIFGVGDINSVEAMQNGDFNALKQALVLRIAKDSMKGSEFVPGQFVNQWNRLLNKNGDLINELFNNGEKKFITNFVDVVSKTMKPKDRGLEEGVGFLNNAIINLGKIFASGAGMQVGGGLYGGFAGRNIFQNIVEIFNKSTAKRQVLEQLKQGKGLMDDLGRSVNFGQAVAEKLGQQNKSLTAIGAPSIGGVVAPISKVYGSNSRFQERNLIPVEDANKGIKKTKRKYEPISEAPTSPPSNIFAANTPGTPMTTGVAPTAQPMDKAQQYAGLFPFDVTGQQIARQG
jgi:hypothetical protein